MKILQKGFTENEFSIQLEDWSEDFDTYKYKYTIGAYPKGGWTKRVRFQCDFTDKNEALVIFEKLLDGSKTVFDYDFTFLKSSIRIPIKDAELKRIV
jgi:uncharacterized protein YxeA